MTDPRADAMSRFAECLLDAEERRRDAADDLMDNPPLLRALEAHRDRGELDKVEALSPMRGDVGRYLACLGGACVVVEWANTLNDPTRLDMAKQTAAHIARQAVMRLCAATGRAAPSLK